MCGPSTPSPFFGGASEHFERCAPEENDRMCIMQNYEKKKGALMTDCTLCKSEKDTLITECLVCTNWRRCDYELLRARQQHRRIPACWLWRRRREGGRGGEGEGGRWMLTFIQITYKYWEKSWGGFTLKVHITITNDLLRNGFAFVCFAFLIAYRGMTG